MFAAGTLHASWEQMFSMEPSALIFTWASAGFAVGIAIIAVGGVRHQPSTPRPGAAPTST